MACRFLSKIIILKIILLLPIIYSCKSKQQKEIPNSIDSLDTGNIEINTKYNLTSPIPNLNEYLFIPPYEDTKIMGRQIKWIHRFPVTINIVDFKAIGYSLYFIADNTSLIEKTKDKWILKFRIRNTDFDDDLVSIWGMDNNSIYVATRKNLYHFDGKNWTIINGWQENNFGYKKRIQQIFGCPNGELLLVTAIVLPGIPYVHHESEVDIFDFYKNGKWETIPQFDKYPHGASEANILGLDCSGNEMKVFIQYDGYIWKDNKLVPADVPEWLKNSKFIVFQFDRMERPSSSWSDNYGFLAAIFPLGGDESSIRFYENGKWQEVARLRHHFGLIWGLSKNDIYLSGDDANYHYNGYEWKKDQVNHLQEMEYSFVPGVKSNQFTYLGGIPGDGIYGIHNTDPQIIFKRNSDGNWWPVYQEYGPYGDEWEWKWMWPSNEKKVFIATSTSIRQFDLGDIPQEKLKLMKVFDFENEKILDAYSINPHQTYLLILDKNQETFINGHLTPGQKTNKRVYIFNGEKAISKTEIDDKKDKYIKIFAFKDNPDAFLLYGEDSIALYNDNKWIEKKVCKIEKENVFNRWGNRQYLLSIWGNSINDFYIAGSMGCLMRKKQDKWIRIWSGTNKNLTAITGNENGEIFIARSDGTLFKFKDNRFEQIDLPTEKDTYITKIVIQNNTYYFIFKNGEIGIYENGKFEKTQLFFGEPDFAFYVKDFGLLVLSVYETYGSIVGILDKNSKI